MRIDDKMGNLSPGMAVTVENQDRLARDSKLSLSPLLRYTGKETWRER